MLPYAHVKALAGSDVFVDLAFMDHTLTPVVPTQIQVELDDLTNAVSMDNGPNTLNPAGSSSGSYQYAAFASGSPTPWVLQIAASVLQKTFPYEGSQICKLKLVFQATDSVTGRTFTAPCELVIELVASPTVSGSF